MGYIKLKEVNKEYGKNKVIESVNLTINEGEILGIIGESGSGKTTLLNLISGFIEPTKGNIVYLSKTTKEEKDLQKNLHKIKKHFGFTPQHNSFYHKLTVKENLRHFGKLYSVNSITLESNINSLLQITRLNHHQDKIADHLSGGMQKRLDIACSLVHKPKILILDEPTADLDPILQKETTRLLKEVNKQGITLIIASHHLAGIEEICDKIAIIKQGRIHSYGSIQEIKKPFLRDHFVIKLHSPKNKEKIINTLKVMPIKKIIDQEDKLIIYPEDTPAILNSIISLIKENEIYLPEMNIKHPPLQDVFESISKE